MFEYFTNVAISFVPAFTIGLVLFFVATVALSLVAFPADQVKKIRSVTVKTVAAVWALGLVYAVVSPSNTYKHEPHNKAALNARIEQQQLNRTSSGVIQDRTRQPEKTTEERKKDFDAMTAYPRSEQ